MSYVQEHQLLKAGQDQQVAKDLLEIVQQTEAFKAIEDDINVLPMAGVIDRLSKSGDFRD